MKGVSTSLRCGLLDFSSRFVSGHDFSRAALGAKRSGLKSLRENSQNSGSPKGAPQIPPLRYAPVGMTILSGNAKYGFQDELSSRPERTRISCHAALDKAACAPFRKEGRMKWTNATKVSRKSGVA